MSDRLLLITTISLPGGTTLIASHYLDPDEDLGASVRERLDVPGTTAVSVTRASKETLLAHLRDEFDADEFALPKAEGVN